MTFDPVVSTSYARLSDLASQRVFDSRDWLTLAERIELDALGHAPRRRQWLAGRWLAKQLIQRAIGDVKLTDIQLLARDERGRGVRPRIRVAGRQLPGSVSISHSQCGVLVALAADSSVSVGVDLAELQPDGSAQFGAGFRRLWFTAGEQQWLDVDPIRDPTGRIVKLWALKEAVYKACNAGEAFCPRQVEILPLNTDRFRCLYRGLKLAPESLAVRELDGHVAAIVQIPLIPTYTRSSRSATPERHDLRAADCPAPVDALPASMPPANAAPMTDGDISHKLRFPTERFQYSTPSQPAVILRKPS